MSVIRETRDTMVKQAIGTLMWSELTEHGEPIDSLYTEDHVSEETRREITEDVINFLDLILDLEDGEMSDRAWELIRNDPCQAGHDFILSRNGHGTGFWDRGTGDVGDELHKWAKTFGEISLYVGDDGYLYN
jgi:hypothetical protein